MLNQPLLSICIPTKNRAPFLNRVLKSIVTQDVFLRTGNVEVVVADNASLDNTKEIVDSFINRFPGRILYYRHAEDIGAAFNLEFVLNHATGIFLKLNNDTLLLNPGSLDKMLSLINETQEEKPILFFHNTDENQKCRYTNLNSFIADISYYVTWIGSFGLWRRDLLEFPDLYREASSLLPQVDILFRFFESGRHAIVLKEHLFTGIPNINKGGYNVAETFGQKYLFFLKKQFDENHITKSIYAKEKKRILLGHINSYYFDIKRLHRFRQDGYFQYLKAYRYNLYFYIEALKWACKALWYRSFFDQEKQMRNAWKYSNAHNSMVPQSSFDTSRILVGNHSCGDLNVIAAHASDAMLVIGHFVYVAKNVKFLLSCNDHTRLSTFPFKLLSFPSYMETKSEDGIVVEDDVWIDQDSLVLSGVKIGQGAIVSAGSVVTQDVPPYSIVGGNPARVLKYRFSQVVIDQLMFLDFSNLTIEMIREKLDLLYTEVNEATVSELVKAFNANRHSQNTIEFFVK